MSSCGCPYRTETIQIYSPGEHREHTIITGFHHTPECTERRWRDRVAQLKQVSPTIEESR